MPHQLPASSTDPNDQAEAAELRRGLVFFWWLVMLLFPLCREAGGGAPPSPILPLPMHAAFVLGSITLLLLVRTQASAAAVPLTTIAPLVVALGLGLELFATLLTVLLRDAFDIVTDVPFYPATFLTVDTLAYGVGAVALGLVTLLSDAAWRSAQAGQASEAMLALLLAYASTRLLLSLCLGLPTESDLAAWNVAAALPLGLGIACLTHRFRPQPESLPPASQP